jgi:hypothetical protein
MRFTPHRSHGLLLLIVTAGLGVTACTSSPTAAPTSTSGEAPTSPSAAILDATQSSLAQDSADIAMVVKATVDSKSIGVTGSGTVDLANSAMRMSMTVQGVPALAGTSISTVLVDGTTYISYPGITTLLPGKSWISQPTSTSSTSGVGVANVSDMLRLLAAKGAVVTKVGVGAIGSTPVTSYDVTLSPALISSQVSALGVPSADSAEVQQILGTSGVTFRVSVSSDGHLRRLSLNMTVPASSSTPAVQESVVVDLTNYGTPVSISAPPADQVATAQQLQGSSN